MFVFDAQAVDPAEIVNQLFPNLWIFLAHLFATFILLFLLSKWVYNPFRRMMRARRQFISNTIKDATTKQADANRNQQLTTIRLEKARTEANLILHDATLEAEHKKLIILNSAREENQNLHDHFQMLIAQEKESMEDDIKKSIVENAFLIADKLVKKRASKAEEEQIINEIIDQLE